MATSEHTSAARRLAIFVLAGLATPLGTLAAPPAPETLSAMEKTKIKRIITLMEKAWDDCKDTKLKDGLAGGGSQIDYEKIDSDGDGAKDDDPTFGDAIKRLKDMVDDDKIKKKAGIGRGSVDVQPGVENDVILLNKADVERLCSGTAGGVTKLSTKIYIGATIANEMAHVYQDWSGGTNQQKCDGEKDSDCSSIKFLEAIKKAIEKDGAANAGMPHTSVGDIDGDGQKVDGLKRCFDDAGVSSAADISTVFTNVCNRLGAVESSAGAGDGKGYKGRKERFEASIGASPFQNWATWYYSGSDASEAVASHAEDEVARAGTRMVADDLLTSSFFSVPAGQVLIASRSFLNANGETMLASVSGDMVGIRQLTVWRDSTGDTLPNLQAAQVFLNEGVNGVMPELYSYDVFWGIPEELSDLATNNGYMFHDKFTGQVFLLDATPDGTPVGNPRFLFADPVVTSAGGGFDFLQEVTNADANSTLFIFGQNDGLPSLENVVWFTVNNATRMGTGTTDPGLFVAEARGILNGIGVDSFTLNQTQLTFFGEPFFSIELYEVGRGIKQFVDFGDTNESGASFPVVLPGPLEANQLYFLDDFSGRTALELVPRVGQPIDSAVNDDNLDMIDDLVFLSEAPPRLHFLAGSPAQPAEVHEHQVEVALEPRTIGGFASWNDVDGRTIIGPEVDIEIVALDLVSVEPIYVQSVLDFDNDQVADEAVVISLPTFGMAWQVTLVEDISTTPIERIQQQTLPMGFEPDSIAYVDIGGDGFLDVQISDHNGGPSICLLNQGNGVDPLQRFAPGMCPEFTCLGDANMDGIVNFGDVTSVLANWLNDYTPGTGPGDADGDGLVNFADVTAALAEWLNTCF